MKRTEDIFDLRFRGSFGLSCSGKSTEVLSTFQMHWNQKYVYVKFFILCKVATLVLLLPKMKKNAPCKSLLKNGASRQCNYQSPHALCCSQRQSTLKLASLRPTGIQRLSACYRSSAAGGHHSQTCIGESLYMGGGRRSSSIIFFIINLARWSTFLRRVNVQTAWLRRLV